MPSAVNDAGSTQVILGPLIQGLLQSLDGLLWCQGLGVPCRICGPVGCVHDEGTLSLPDVSTVRVRRLTREEQIAPGVVRCEVEAKFTMSCLEDNRAAKVVFNGVEVVG